MSKLEVPLKDNEAYRAACIIGSGVGGLTTLEFSYKMLFKENKRATHPLTLLKAIGSSASAHVSIEYAIKGPTFGVVSACSTATHSIGLTYRMIREGLVDIGLAGAAEASLNWGATRAWQAMRVLSPDGLWPFAKKRQRHRARRGRRHPDAGRARARQGARCADPCRADGLRHDGRRRRHGQPLHRRRLDRHADGARRRASSRPPTSTTSTPTALRPPSTTSTRPAPSSACSAMPRTSSRSPRPSRCTAIASAPAAASRPWPRSRPSARNSCRRRSASTSPIRNATSTTPPNVGRAARGQLRDVELLCLRRPERGPRIRTASGLASVPP